MSCSVRKRGRTVINTRIKDHVFAFHKQWLLFLIRLGAIIIFSFGFPGTKSGINCRLLISWEWWKIDWYTVDIIQEEIITWRSHSFTSQHALPTGILFWGYSPLENLSVVYFFFYPHLQSLPILKSFINTFLKFRRRLYSKSLLSRDGHTRNTIYG